MKCYVYRCTCKYSITSDKILPNYPRCKACKQKMKIITVMFEVLIEKSPSTVEEPLK